MPTTAHRRFSSLPPSLSFSLLSSSSSLCVWLRGIWVARGKQVVVCARVEAPPTPPPTPATPHPESNNCGIMYLAVSKARVWPGNRTGRCVYIGLEVGDTRKILGHTAEAIYQAHSEPSRADSFWHIKGGGEGGGAYSRSQIDHNTDIQKGF